MYIVLSRHQKDSMDVPAPLTRLAYTQVGTDGIIQIDDFVDFVDQLAKMLPEDTDNKKILDTVKEILEEEI